MSVYYSHNGIELHPVRTLSANEKNALDKSIDAIQRIRNSKTIQQIEAQAALEIILCAEPSWYALAERTVNAIKLAKDNNTRIGMKLRVEGMIIGLTEIFEVRYNLHSGEVIANSIDNMTRNPMRDAVPGAFNHEMALSVITRAYAKDKETVQ